MSLPTHCKDCVQCASLPKIVCNVRAPVQIEWVTSSFRGPGCVCSCINFTLCPCHVSCLCFDRWTSYFQIYFQSNLWSTLAKIWIGYGGITLLPTSPYDPNQLMSFSIDWFKSVGLIYIIYIMNDCKSRPCGCIKSPLQSLVFLSSPWLLVGWHKRVFVWNMNHYWSTIPWILNIGWILVKYWYNAWLLVDWHERVLVWKMNVCFKTLSVHLI